MTKSKNILLTLFPPVWPSLPPLGIFSLHESLCHQGISSVVLDCNNYFYQLADEKQKQKFHQSCNTTFENQMTTIIKNLFPLQFNELLKKMMTFDTIGFSCFKSNLQTTLSVCHILKREKKTIAIILGGPEITRHYFKTKGAFSTEVYDNADLIVVGEGEKPLIDFMKGHHTKSKVIAFEELDSLQNVPFPRYTCCDLTTYPRKKTIPITLSRGCIKHCHFCSERLLYKKFRLRPIRSVLAEIAHHRHHHGITNFIFFDSLINAHLENLEELCDGIITQFGQVQWEAQLYIRTDMSDSLLQKIKQSGCYNLFIGLESGSTKTLQKMNKGYTATDALLFFEKLNNAGLHFGISLLVGYPDETEQECMESLEFIINNKALIPKIEQINPFTYYDGTHLDKSKDYSTNTTSQKRFELFVSTIKKHNIKHTNAFLGNLIEKNSGSALES
ncbi:B12-binding domain-containing radical SAM protein [Chlamydiota bacterium]